MAEGTALAHVRKKKVYLALNVFPRNDDLEAMAAYLPRVAQTGIDAVIVADPGVFQLVQRVLPEMSIHISTQANLCNQGTVNFWEAAGARRAVLARELTLNEIRQIRETTKLELEVFVHGSMCMAYSGRCLLSSYLTGRDANRGDCAQPCRWEYTLCEEKRPGQSFPVIEEEGGTYLLNSKDLNLIRHLPELISAGVNSLKIEGRMKSLYYVAAVTRIYRRALDSYREDPAAYCFREAWWEELQKVSHRPYTTGFLFTENDTPMQTPERADYIQPYDFMGIVMEADGKRAKIEARNKVHVGDRIEWIGPQSASFESEIQFIHDLNGHPLSWAQPQQMFITATDRPVASFDLLRRRKGRKSPPIQK